MELLSPTEFVQEYILAIQEYAVLSGQAIANIFRRPRYLNEVLMQADLVGVGSLPVVIMTGFSIGASLALQSSNTLQRFGSLSLTGQLVSLSMVRELGPLLTGMMVAGRNSSGMASELGSMKVTEQIDAMRALGTDPIKKLVTPRVLSSVVMLFILTIIGDLVGLGGGWTIARLVLGLDSNQYWSTAWQSLQFADVFMGLLKPLLFGFIISTIGCYYGLFAKGGTQGVGRATTQAVVVADVLIVVVDFFVSKFLMSIMHVH
jgi:phospholipid/cholesterol/gamma-HCH transport system permease protein